MEAGESLRIHALTTMLLHTLIISNIINGNTLTIYGKSVYSRNQGRLTQ
jgi:hypothetical protein